MKTRRLWLVALSLIFSICMCIGLAACNTDGNDNDDGSKTEVTALATPTVTIDNNGKASWNEVANASGYAFKVNDGAEQTATTREVQLENGQSIAVKAKGDGVNYSDSTWSAAKTYTAPTVVNPVKLGTPAVTIYENGLAAWNAISNASGYVVKIGEDETGTTATSTHLRNGETVSVKAVGNGTSYLTGDFSTPKTYKATASNLNAPENLSAEIQGTDEGKVILSWNAVNGASGYVCTVNGSELDAVSADETSYMVDLSNIDATKLDSTWTFQVKSLGSYSDEIADDGDYSAYTGSSNYCEEINFSISNDEFYTVAEISKIMNYYGEHLPSREFAVMGTIQSNTDGNAVLEDGFTLFGTDVPELYLAIDGKLVNIEVTAFGYLTLNGEVKGLASYRSVDFENLTDDERYQLAIETLEAWDMLKSDSRIMSDFYIPVKLYGANLMWSVFSDVTGAFTIDDYGNVTVTCPADGEEDISVKLNLALYIDIENNRMCSDEVEFTFTIAPNTLIQLATPKINIAPKTGIATWNEIENAIGYRVNYYGFSVPGDYYSEYIDKNIVIAADGERSVQLKDGWWIKVWAIGDGKTYKDSEVDPKQYNYYPETVEPDGTPLAFDMTKLTQTGDLANPTYIFGLACGNASVFESASATRVVLGNDDVNGAFIGTGFIKVGSSNNDGKITLNFNKKINGVVITACQWNEDERDKVSVNGSDEQTASKNGWGIMYFNFTAAKASTKVEITTNNRVLIKNITVYVAN